jgi:hypothetical protein
MSQTIGVRNRAKHKAQLKFKSRIYSTIYGFFVVC